MSGEEDEFVGEDGAPDNGGENPDAGLPNGSSACDCINNGYSPRFSTNCTHQSTGCDRAAAPASDWHRLSAQEAAPLQPGRAPRRQWVGFRSQKPFGAHRKENCRRSNTQCMAGKERRHSKNARREASEFRVGVWWKLRPTMTT